MELERTWHVEPGAGSEPGVLERSDDGGATWQPVQAILERPTRDRWHPGAGGLCCHSIQVDPADPTRPAVAISAAGAFTSTDGGESFAPANSGVAADPHLEVGQCVHKLLLHAGRPGRLWQQNHCGVYRSDDFGSSWERLDGNGLPSGFGFALALDLSCRRSSRPRPAAAAASRSRRRR